MNLAANMAAVEIDDRTIRVVVVKTGSKVPAVLESHTIEAVYEDPEERYDALVIAARQVVAAVNGPISAWVYCASSEYGVARALRIPFKGARRVRAVVPGELEPMLAVPIEELIIDQQIIREYEGQTDVLAIAQREGIINENVSILREAGAHVEAVTNDVAALTSLWRSMRRTVSNIEGVLHVRPGNALFVLATSKSLVWYCQIPLTSEQMHDDPARLVQAIQNALRSFFANWVGDSDISALTITGHVDESLREALSETLDVPVTVQDLLVDIKGVELLANAPDADDVSGFHELGEEAERFTPLIGTAVAAAGKGYRVSFLPADFAGSISAKSATSHFVFSAILLVTALLGYGAYCFADYRGNERRVTLIRDEIQQIYEESFPGTTPSIEGSDPTGNQLVSQLEEAMMASQSGAGIGVPPEWLEKPLFLDLLKELSQYFPSDRIDLTEVRVTSGRSGGIEVTGEFDMASQHEFYLEAFQKLREESVFPWEDTGEFRGANGRGQFKIRAQYGPKVRGE